MFEQGEQFRFGLNIDVKYGEGSSQELQFLSLTTLKKARFEYENDIRYYKAIVENLKKEKDIE